MKPLYTLLLSIGLMLPAFAECTSARIELPFSTHVQSVTLARGEHLLRLTSGESAESNVVAVYTPDGKTLEAKLKYQPSKLPVAPGSNGVKVQAAAGKFKLVLVYLEGSEDAFNVDLGSGLTSSDE